MLTKMHIRTTKIKEILGIKIKHPLVAMIIGALFVPSATFPLNLFIVTPMIVYM